MSTNLNQLIVKLQELQYQGHGLKEVFYRHSASGDCGPVNSPHLSDEVSDDTGPFDLKPGEEYVCIRVGN